MILVDTSVWVDHLRHGNAELARLLKAGQVLTHPFVTGELVLGDLRQREAVLESVQNLPRAQMAKDNEVLTFIVRNRLSATGIGYVDAHLLAAVRLTPRTKLWTMDKRLSAVAERLAD